MKKRTKMIRRKIRSDLNRGGKDTPEIGGIYYFRVKSLNLLL